MEIAPGVRRLTAPNPGMMTGPGTNSYLIGSDQIVVIDPGPMIEAHLEKLAAVGNIRWILATHTHPDHSPGATELAKMTGAVTIGMPPPQGPHQDQTFHPDRSPADGEWLDCPDFAVQFLHTPGHASNHVCFLLREYGWLFTGDHVMNGSTVVIDPPDGDMLDYLASLRRLRCMPISGIGPGHGAMIDNPIEVIDWIIDHRLTREAKVVSALHEHPDLRSAELVPYVYTDVDKRLHGLAERSLLAHLIKLEKDGGARQIEGRWRHA